MRSTQFICPSCGAVITDSQSPYCPNCLQIINQNKVGNEGYEQKPAVRRVRRVSYESFDHQGRPVIAWIEGDIEGWADEGYAIAFHGKSTHRIPKNKIVSDTEYDSDPMNQCCFISTAVYTNMGFDDNCSDLKTLRKYRDTHLLKTTYGRELINNYYLIAPLIVDQINSLPNKNQIYSNIYDEYIKNIVDLINHNKFETAAQKYEKMVYDLLIQYKH